MQKFTRLNAAAAPLPVANIDTDQIIPKQYLSTVDRAGLGKGLFHDMRYADDGTPLPEFVLNRAAYQNAGILIAGANFGCGSSREHAPWALLDFGITCVIAPSFADIFYNNCFKNGILPIVLPGPVVEQLIDQARGDNARFEVDLAAQTVTAPDGVPYRFEIDPGRKQNLLAGLDEIGESLTQGSAIEAHEARRRLSTPWLEPA